MNTSKPPMNAFRPLNTLAAAGLFFSCLSSQAQTVWNVNVGSGVNSGTNQITTTNNYLGAATENTAGSTWNAVFSSSLVALADSTGSSSAGVTFQLTAAVGSVVGFGAQNLNSGDKIFNTWIKDGVGPAPDGVNDDPFTVTFGGLSPSTTYELVIYSDWWWDAVGNPVVQTAGAGLTGTFFVNSQIGGSHIVGTVPALMEDTNPADVSTAATNYSRLRGLTPNGSGNLSFSVGAANAPINGFQLVSISSGPPDTTSPAPNPMTWLSAPAAASSSSIIMTATTASDPSGVEYYFDETSGNPGGTDSGWQNSASYTDAGLTANTSYTYTVSARDKSAAKNPTAVSAPASATTGATSASTVWNLNLGNQITTGDNFVGAAAENTGGSTWNRVSSVPQAGMALKDSTGATTAGVTIDITSSHNVGGQTLTSGDKIFNGWIGGAGATSNMTIKGLSMTNSYDLVIYSDWWWFPDSYPVAQTKGTGLSGTAYINHIPKSSNGIVSALTEDINPADVASGTGNIGNWHRLKGLSPTPNGELGFLLGDGANGPFNGFQLVATPIPPRADMLTFTLSGNPPVIRNALISGTNVTLTMPYGSNVTNVAPTFTLWPGATCVPVSGTARNFTSPQTYTVTSSDSLVTKIYTVTAVIAPPLPEYTLTAPASWDGRATITVQPNISNLALLQANGGTNFTYLWSVSGEAVTRQITPGVLTLTRSQGSGPLLVTLILANGTSGVTQSTTINIQEPETDPWIARTPGINEKPVTGQFFARDPITNLGTIFYNGTQTGSPASVYLKIYQTPSGGTETLDATLRQPLVSGSYAFSAPITAGLITYRVVFGTTSGVQDTDVATVTDLVCGDAYIIEGQSNAAATDNSAARDDVTSPWIRTYGRDGGAWGRGFSKPSDPFWEWRLGMWGMELAKRIVANHQMPVCFINGSVGGTLIDQHQANPANHTIAGSLYSIYANLLNRVIAAKLTHGIRGIFWHQGESDCSNFGTISDYDYTAYQQYFLDMSAAWKQDYPNLQRYIIYQVMPKPCGIGPKGDQLREAQRTLPRMYSNMSILNTLGTVGYEGCHFSAVGYANFANRLSPLVSYDFYEIFQGDPVTAPNLKMAYFTTAARTAITLEFDQAMSWNSFSLANYYVDKVAGKVTSGSASGNVVTLQLSSAAATTATLDYLRDDFWNLNESVSSLLYGSNAIPALTFADVPIASLTPYQSWASSKNLSGAAAAGDADPDLDGIKNALEYVLGGEPNPATPGSNSVALLPTSTRNGAGDLVFTFQRKIVSLGGVSLSFQWSGDLTIPALDSVLIGATGSTVNGINVAISNLDVATETIIITVPAAKAAGGKLFGQLRATAP